MTLDEVRLEVGLAMNVVLKRKSGVTMGSWVELDPDKKLLRQFVEDGELQDGSQILVTSFD